MATQAQAIDDEQLPTTDDLLDVAKHRVLQSFDDEEIREHPAKYHPKNRYLPYSPTNDPKPHVEGKTCAHCGYQGHEHNKQRETDDEGRHRYFYLCPSE